MAKLTFSKEQIFGDWKLIQNLAYGGNSSVWLAENAKLKETKAIKLLKKTHDTARLRFLDEIKIITENQDIDGIMKILDTSVKDSEVLWYVMPKMETFKRHLVNKPSINKVEGILEIAKILSQIHSRKVSHRDIKPQNLFFNETFYIGDFGLVDYPDKENDLTIIGSALGPRWTIAPEMRSNPEKSDGIPADVYSLTKTLWITLTGIEKGFEGQYSPTGSIGLSNYVPDIYLTILEDLLVISTENDPKQRPSIDKFIEILSSWIEIQNSFYQRNDLDWKTVQYKLFPSNIPEYAEWTDVQTITNILNILGGIKALNHMFFDNGGGLDMEGAKLSNELGLIELDCGIPYLLKPKRLMFNSFNSDFEWNYFYLELEKIEPIYSEYSGSEQIVELEPLEYKEYDYIENYYEKYDDGYNHRPEKHRSIIRLTEGNLVIFRKTSSYNLTPSTYDGRHGEMGAEEFRKYIKKLVDIGYRAYYIRDENGKVTGKQLTHKI
ncbi:protein kinase [Tenacibaculum sp. AHE15PA]|uniref:protein kinase domain-containing protein n=1 Tax=unclassified Tenacibaculum TaxID=2635139 RepID=UPI001C4F67BC|nr:MULTISPECIES: protein kinase [unclassified Tenacibaculum]QXP74676.1 protein kinase [Tenacibaculum sp. AHE14PA]QXP76187.1 protein kinase [Tenacibaculum sp. AHE15PA]